MRNFVVAVLLAILITYSCGHIFSEWFDVSIRMDDQLLEPFAAILGLSIAAVVMVIIGFVIAVSVFGVVVVATLAVGAGLVFAGLAAFWPMILMLLVVYWLVREKRPAHY